MKKALILGKVWPEPGSSAAGTRLIQLMEILWENQYQLFFASPAQPGEHSFDPSIFDAKAQVLPINETSADEYFKELNPDLVIFDRFTTEEQFGWRIAACCPDCIRVLDTEDLHCLRAERQKAIKKAKAFQFEDLLSSDVARREIASIYRCDLSLIISKPEYDILRTVFKVDVSLLHYIPLFVDNPNLEFDSLPSFDEREHFVSIGNFLHEPNRDSVFQLREKIWPLIRKKLPKAEMHVYGAYADDQVIKIHDEKNGFIIKGRATDVPGLFKSAKACLAYLRFGAGLKGKLMDAMQAGTPSVTTSIGIEGLGETETWPGAVENDTEQFASAAIRLYTDKTSWQEKQKNIPDSVKQFDKHNFSSSLLQRFSGLKAELKKHRDVNFIGNMLQHHSVQSTKYMALWIEAKNKLAAMQQAGLK